MIHARPQATFTEAQQPQGDLRTGISDLANGARTTAFLIEEGATAGVDIINQFGQLFGMIIVRYIETVH